MNDLLQQPIGDIAAERPATVRVFQRYGIDFCCGGKQPLKVVCAEKGLDEREIVAQLEAVAGPAVAQSAPSATSDWRTAPLNRLVNHIVETYHDPLLGELPRLDAMALKVARVHGAHHPFLVELQETVSRLRAELEHHMADEEQRLFPAIKQLYAAAANNLGSAAPNPLDDDLSRLEAEHRAAGAALARIRSLTTEFSAPAEACNTWRGLYHGLSELETTMHRHVHLENHVLFPRAAALATEVAR